MVQSASLSSKLWVWFTTEITYIMLVDCSFLSSAKFDIPVTSQQPAATGIMPTSVFPTQSGVPKTTPQPRRPLDQVTCFKVGAIKYIFSSYPLSLQCFSSFSVERRAIMLTWYVCNMQSFSISMHYHVCNCFPAVSKVIPCSANGTCRHTSTNCCKYGCQITCLFLNLVSIVCCQY